MRRALSMGRDQRVVPASSLFERQVAQGSEASGNSPRVAPAPGPLFVGTALCPLEPGAAFRVRLRGRGLGHGSAQGVDRPGGGWELAGMGTPPRFSQHPPAWPMGDPGGLPRVRLDSHSPFPASPASNSHSLCDPKGSQECSVAQSVVHRPAAPASSCTHQPDQRLGPGAATCT